jgi:hypothetical protein
VVNADGVFEGHDRMQVLRTHFASPLLADPGVGQSKLIAGLHGWRDFLQIEFASRIL